MYLIKYMYKYLPSATSKQLKIVYFEANLSIDKNLSSI